MTSKTFKTEGARLTLYFDGPVWEGQKTATIGDVSFKTAEAGAPLLADAIAQATSEGRTRVLGPMSGDTWHSYRFVSESDGSAPFLMEPTNTPLEADVFRAAGFTTVSRYFSARMALVQAPPPPATDAFTLETWDGHDPEALFRQVYRLSLEAFAQNAFYTPISEADFLALYMPVVPMIKPDLIYIARRPDGTLAGFLFAIPNYAEGLESKTLILKTYASLVRGAGRHMVHAVQSHAFQAGYETVIHALIHNDNQSAERSAQEGAQIFRRYELLGLRLDG